MSEKVPKLAGHLRWRTMPLRAALDVTHINKSSFRGVRSVLALPDQRVHTSPASDSGSGESRLISTSLSSYVPLQCCLDATPSKEQSHNIPITAPTSVNAPYTLVIALLVHIFPLVVICNKLAHTSTLTLTSHFHHQLAIPSACIPLALLYRPPKIPYLHKGLHSTLLYQAGLLANML